MIRSAAVLGCLLVVGCASSSEAGDVDVNVDVDGVGTKAAYTNGAGQTITAFIDSERKIIDATMTLTGATTATPAGICILQKSSWPCSNDDAAGDVECGGAGHRCLRSNNIGAAYCHTSIACNSGFWTSGTYTLTAIGGYGATYTANSCFGRACDGGRSTSGSKTLVFTNF